VASRLLRFLFSVFVLVYAGGLSSAELAEWKELNTIDIGYLELDCSDSVISISGPSNPVPVVVVMLVFVVVFVVAVVFVVVDVVVLMLTLILILALARWFHSSS